MFPVEGSGILNSVFKELSVGWFPPPPLGSVLELPVTTSVSDAVALLLQHDLCVEIIN